jgi:hypothetical protein
MSRASQSLDTDNQELLQSLTDAEAKISALSAELDAQKKAREEAEVGEAVLKASQQEFSPDPVFAMEAKLAEDVENILTRQTVVLEELKDAIHAQVAYYKRKTAFYSGLNCTFRNQRDQVEKHICLIETEASNIIGSAEVNDKVRWAMGAVQAAVKDATWQLQSLETIIPVRMEPGTPESRSNVSSNGRASRSKQRGNFLGINQLVSDFTDSVQAIIKALRSTDIQNICSMNKLLQVREQELQTCRQRLKERDLQIRRLEDRIRHEGGIVSDFALGQDFNLKEKAVGTNKIDNITQILLSQISIANEDIKTFGARLQKQEASDPNDTFWKGNKLRGDIARITAEKKMAEKRCEDKKSALKKVVAVTKSQLEAERASLRRCRDANEYLKAQAKELLGTQESNGTELGAKIQADITNLVTEEMDKKKEIENLQGAPNTALGEVSKVRFELATRDDELAIQVPSYAELQNRLRDEENRSTHLQLHVGRGTKQTSGTSHPARASSRAAFEATVRNQDTRIAALTSQVQALDIAHAADQSAIHKLKQELTVGSAVATSSEQEIRNLRQNYDARVADLERSLAVCMLPFPSPRLLLICQNRSS